MSNFCRKMILFAFLLTFAGALSANGNDQLYYRNFWHPDYRGARLDYCTMDGSQCGMAVANRYCKTMGYLRANQAIKANNLGVTKYIDSRGRCQGWQCNGFKTIRCVGTVSKKPPKFYHYSMRRFVYPRYDNFRIDWCYDGEKGCGRRVAQSFCRRMGFLQTKKFTIERCVPATKALGNQKLCFGPQCNAFHEITCSR